MEYLNFIKDDIQTGLLKNIPVGMIRRTLKFKDSVKFEEFSYLRIVKDEMKGGIKE